MQLLNLRSDSSINKSKRFEKTFKFLSKHLSGYTVLGVGGYSDFDYDMSKLFALDYSYTTSDLNYSIKINAVPRKYQVIFCFEVIEHLINPGLFLRNLQLFCDKNTQIFISYPENVPFFRNPTHFHEYSQDEFFTLIDSEGFKIIEYESYRHWGHPVFYVSGLRPIVRFIFKILGVSKRNFYYLKVKG